MQEFSHATRPIWFALILFFALAVGASGGLLSWADTHRIASSVLSGAGAFAATVGLGIAAYHFLQEKK